MPSTKPILSVVAVLLLVGGAQAAWAHQDPPGCNNEGPGIAIFPFRADGVTPIGSNPVSNCETIVFKAQVKYQASTTSVPTCAFEGGNLILTTPDGIDHTTNVPCVGGTTNDPNSASNGGRGQCLGAPTSFPDPETGVTYTVRDQDIVNGFVAVNAKYPETLGTSFNHTSSTDSVGGTVTDQLPVAVVSCPAVTTGCEQAGCDPVTFACFDNRDTCPVANTGCEQAGCDPTQPFKSTCDPANPTPDCFACFDRHDSCTVVSTGCEQAGCDPTLAFPGCFDRHDTCTVISTGCEQAGCDATQPFPGCFDRHDTCKVASTGCEQAGCDPTLAFPGCFDRHDSCTVASTGCEQAGCDPTLAFPGCFDRHDSCKVASTGCEQAGCDPTKTFPGCFDNTASCKSVTNGCEQAGCDTTKTFPGCFDNTNNGCRTADTFCEQAGCDLTATTFPACFVNDKGNGTPCGGTPGAPTPLECHTDCCEAGVCVGDSAACLQPDSTPCADTDNIACSTPGCDACVCNQNHIPCPTGICRTPGFWATHAGTEKGRS